MPAAGVRRLRPRTSALALLVLVAPALLLSPLVGDSGFVPWAPLRGVEGRATYQAEIFNKPPAVEQPPIGIVARGAATLAGSMVLGLVLGLAGAPLEVSANGQGLQGIPSPFRPDSITEANRADIRKAVEAETKEEVQAVTEKFKAAAVPGQEPGLAKFLGNLKRLAEAFPKGEGLQGLRLPNTPGSVTDADWGNIRKNAEKLAKEETQDLADKPKQGSAAPGKKDWEAERLTSDPEKLRKEAEVVPTPSS